MTQTKKRTWIWVVIIVLSVTVALAGIGLYWIGSIWLVKEVKTPHVSELSYFSDSFISDCRLRGLYLPTSAEFVRGQYISEFQEGTYCVTFRISAEHEHCLLPEQELKEFYKSSLSPDEEMPDDGVTYAWYLPFAGADDKLYLSDATEDGYVYCYVEFWD